MKIECSHAFCDCHPLPCSVIRLQWRILVFGTSANMPTSTMYICYISDLSIVRLAFISAAPATAQSYHGPRSSYVKHHYVYGCFANSSIEVKEVSTFHHFQDCDIFFQLPISEILQTINESFLKLHSSVY